MRIRRNELAAEKILAATPTRTETNKRVDGAGDVAKKPDFMRALLDASRKNTVARRRKELPREQERKKQADRDNDPEPDF